MILPSALTPLVEYVQARLTVEPHVIAGLPETLPIRVEGGTPSVLCIHGFTGVPAEVRIGCEVARSLGLAAEAPCLAGHGASSADLATTRFEDWVESARPAFDRLRARGPVVLVGLSMGALVAARLALDAPGDVAGVAFLANAFWLNSPYPSRALAWADWMKLPDFAVKKGFSDLGDEEARKTQVSYRVQPVRAAVSLLRAGEKMREEVHRLHRPTLILHGARDRVCPVRNAWKLAELISTPDIRVVVFPRSHHILTRDIERARVARELSEFVGRLTQVGPMRIGDG